MLYLISAIMLFVGFSCDKNDDVRIEDYEKAEIEWPNCISDDQGHLMKLEQVKGQIISKKIELFNRSITLIKGSDGKEYLPCDSDFLNENIGAYVIFSGDTYAGGMATEYIYYAKDGFLKLNELWVRK